MEFPLWRCDGIVHMTGMLKGYMLFGGDRSGRCGGGVTFYVRLHLECIKLCLGVDDEQVENLCVGIKGQTSEGNIVVGVCYRSPDQEEEVDEAFYRQLEAASKSQALVFVGDFNYPDIC
ncbi:mitochondrial fission process protein 1 [Pitangus sulphuratus]|nr:mitochondrial fission process protein 1 [Pitangus sulphuratus]